MTGLPPTPKIEIEFTAGVWTDVTTDVDWTRRVSLKFGRNSEFSAPQVASMTFDLDDNAGKYTAKNAASPYYPNVVPRKRVRYTLSGGTIPRFLGYIKGWPPRYENGTRRFVPIVATDRFDQLSRRSLLPIAQQAILSDLPSYFWPLSDAALGNLLELAGNPNQVTWGPFNQTAGSTLGSTGIVPVSEGTTSLILARTSANDGSIFGIGSTSPITISNAGFTMAGWVMPLSAGATDNLTFQIGSGSLATLHQPSARLYLVRDFSSGDLVANISVADPTNSAGNSANVTSASPNGAVHLAATVIAGGAVNLYINGVLAVSSTLPSITVQTMSGVSLVSQQFGGAIPNSGAWQDIAIWGSTVLTAAQVLNHYQAGATAFAGDLPGARIARILNLVGMTAADYNLAAGQVTLGPSTGLGGQSVTSAVQQIATTEGGGAAVFVDTDGRVRFVDRTFRSVATAAVTIDAVTDLDGPSFQPEYDDLTLVNDSTVTRSGGTAQRYVDASSVAVNGTTSDSATSYASTDAAALLLAQDRVSKQSTLRLRMPKVAVDFMTATLAYSVLASLTIGSRLRVQSIQTTETTPAGTFVRFPFSQLDGNIEGWTEMGGRSSYDVAWDVSPADAPARKIRDSATFGRWAAVPGTATLQAAITAGATSLVVVTSAAGTPFTNTAGDFPFTIVIDDEVITLTAASGSATSPQTFTVTRAAAGTLPAAHAINAIVNVYPTATWSL